METNFPRELNVISEFTKALTVHFVVCIISSKYFKVAIASAPMPYFQPKSLGFPKVELRNLFRQSVSLLPALSRKNSE